MLGIPSIRLADRRPLKFCHEDSPPIVFIAGGEGDDVGGISVILMDNKDSQGTSDVIAHDLHGALFHAPVMFSPGVESDPQNRNDNDIRYGPIYMDRWPSFSIIASDR